MSHSLGLMTVSEAADYLNIPRPTLYQHLREGRIPGIQIGGRWRIESEELRRVIGAETEESQQQPPQNQPHQPVQNRGSFSSQATSPQRTSAEVDAEIRHLTEENVRLREIIAQQLLELHKLAMEQKETPETPIDRAE